MQFSDFVQSHLVEIFESAVRFTGSQQTQTTTIVGLHIIRLDFQNCFTLEGNFYKISGSVRSAETLALTAFFTSSELFNLS